MSRATAECCGRRPCALVATIHDLAPFHLPGKYDWLRMFYGRVIARRRAGRQDEIIAVSQLTARHVADDFHVPSSRVTVIPNGLDHGQFHPGSRDLAREKVCVPRGVDGPFFLYVARLEHPAKKNHERLIAAYNRFRASSQSSWQLVLAGGDWHGAETIHRLIDASPFARDIHRLGFVPASELPDWYRAAGALVFPSLYEGLWASAGRSDGLAAARYSVPPAARWPRRSATPPVRLNPTTSPRWRPSCNAWSTTREWRDQLRAAGLVRARAL